MVGNVGAKNLFKGVDELVIMVLFNLSAVFTQTFTLFLLNPQLQTRKGQALYHPPPFIPEF